MEILKFFIFLIFYHFLLFFHKLQKRSTRGGVAGKMDHYPQRIRQGAPGVAPLSSAHRHPFAGGIFFKFEFYFSNFELLSSAHRLSIRHRYTPFILGALIHPKRIYFPEHFCYCFSSNLCVLNTTNTN
jgi:hypothetical protein